MSVEERLSQLEEEAEKPREVKRECFFCVDREKHNFWHNTTVTDKLIKEAFAKCGVYGCDHKHADETSIWFADFMAGALLTYVIENHNERQTDIEFLDKTVRDEKIMIPAMEYHMKETLEEFPLWKFDEQTRPFIKAKHDRFPTWIQLAKEMYEKMCKDNILENKNYRHEEGSHNV